MSCPNCKSGNTEKYIGEPSLEGTIMSFPILRGAKAAYHLLSGHGESYQWLCLDCGTKFVQCDYKECGRYVRIKDNVFFKDGDLFICPYCKHETVAMARYNAIQAYLRSLRGR